MHRLMEVHSACAAGTVVAARINLECLRKCLQQSVFWYRVRRRVEDPKMNTTAISWVSFIVLESQGKVGVSQRAYRSHRACCLQKSFFAIVDAKITQYCSKPYHTSRASLGSKVDDIVHVGGVVETTWQIREFSKVCGAKYGMPSAGSRSRFKLRTGISAAGVSR